MHKTVIDVIFKATVDLQEALEMSQLRTLQVSDFNEFLIVSVVMVYRDILTVFILDNINAVHDKFLVREAHDQEREHLKLNINFYKHHNTASIFRISIFFKLGLNLKKKKHISSKFLIKKAVKRVKNMIPKKTQVEIPVIDYLTETNLVKQN